MAYRIDVKRLLENCSLYLHNKKELISIVDMRGFLGARCGHLKQTQTGYTMKPFIFEQWHAWDKQNPFAKHRIYLSDESEGYLRDFESVDAAINWLFLNGHKDAARALNAHKKV